MLIKELTYGSVTEEKKAVSQYFYDIAKSFYFTFSRYSPVLVSHLIMSPSRIWKGICTTAPDSPDFITFEKEHKTISNKPHG